MKERTQQMVAFRAWSDEYGEFKAICHERRTTPTAMLNGFLRTTVAEYNREQKEREEKPC